MKSSTGAYFVGLDHIRGVAAFLVFEWHFIHAAGVPFSNVPTFWPASILEEGHCGVALFMTLSGYLFAKLLDGKDVIYKWFLWNRFLRLAPLLTVVVLAYAPYDSPAALFYYVKQIAKGTVFTILPNGWWSITVEAHFYILLPAILFLLRRNPMYAALMGAAAITLRSFLFWKLGQVQTLAYWTLIGCIDLFVLGMAAYNLRNWLKGNHIAITVAFVAFVSFYHYFNALGGFYDLPYYPSPSPIWIVLPTAEGLFFSMFIAYYDNTFAFRTDGISGLLAKIGMCSYSIYLLHTFFVIRLGERIGHIVPLTNFYAATAVSLVCFLAFVPFAWLSYRYFESPFLTFRRKYTRSAPSPGAMATATA